MPLAHLLAAQLRRPSGRFGRWVMTRALNRGNADLIEECVAALELREDDTVIYFWPDLPRTLSSLARVRAPAGRLVIGFSGKDKLDQYGSVTDHGFTKRSDAEVVAAAREAGFTSVTSRALSRGRSRGDFVVVAERDVSEVDLHQRDWMFSMKP